MRKKIIRFLKVYFTSLFVLLLNARLYAQVPSDNPYQSLYLEANHWTNSIAWSTVVDVSSVPGVVNGKGVVDSLVMHQTMQSLSKKGGGVLFFPKGTYYLNFNVQLMSGVVLRGEASDKVKSAAFLGFCPLTRFQFPKYIPSFEGNGAPVNTAFKKILADTVSTHDFGLVNLDIDRATIGFYAIGYKQMVTPDGLMMSAEQYHYNVILFAVRLNNGVLLDPDIPTENHIGEHRAWQRWPWISGASIDISVSKNCVVANCLLNDSVDSYQPPSHLVTEIGEIVPGSQSRFNYGMNPGIFVNSAKVDFSGTRTFRTFYNAHLPREYDFLKTVNFSNASSSPEYSYMAIDGDFSTRWTSISADDQWFYVDLGKPTLISKIELEWETAHGKAYGIDLSSDMKKWEPVFQESNSNGGKDEITFDSQKARFIRLSLIKRINPEWGFSLWEIKVFDPNGLELLKELTNKGKPKVSEVISDFEPLKSSTGIEVIDNTINSSSPTKLNVIGKNPVVKGNKLADVNGVRSFKLDALAADGYALYDTFRISVIKDSLLFRRYSYVTERKKSISYRMMSPKTIEKGKKYPLIIYFAPGGNEYTSLMHFVWRFAAENVRQEFPSYVVVPVLSTQELHSLLKPESEVGLHDCIDLIESISKNYSVDKNRIYLAGLSKSGHVAYGAIEQYPKKFAAVTLIGVVQKVNEDALKKTKQTKFWLSQGQNDQWVPTPYARFFSKKLSEAGMTVKYKEYKGGHMIWNETFKDPDFLPWLFAQHL